MGPFNERKVLVLSFMEDNSRRQWRRSFEAATMEESFVLRWFLTLPLYSRDSLTASPETERSAPRGEAKLRENTIAKARLCTWEMWEFEKMSRSRGFSWDRA